MRIRIGPGGRVLSLVVVGILTVALVQGSVDTVQSAPAANSQCVAPTPAPFLSSGAVQIDVKPGAPRNPVNVKSGGLVEIAICSDSGPGATFNAPAQVWVKCNPTGPDPTSPSCRDKPGTSTPATSLPPSSPTAGATGLELSLHSCNSVRDVNGDGVPDLVCHFFVNRMGLGPTSTIITLRGCCDTPEFQGANFINCAADCLPSIPPPPPCPEELC